MITIEMSDAASDDVSDDWLLHPCFAISLIENLFDMSAVEFFNGAFGRRDYGLLIVGFGVFQH